MRHVLALLAVFALCSCTRTTTETDGSPPGEVGPGLEQGVDLPAPDKGPDGPKPDVSVADLGNTDVWTPCGNPHADSFTQQLNRKVDILFVIDPSGSMMDEKPRLLATAPAFAAAAASNQLDFQLGAVSMTKPGSSSASFTLGALHGDPRYVTASTPNLQQEFVERIDLPVGAGTELGFDAILAAFSKALTDTVNPTSCTGCNPPDICESGGCRGANWGFRRSDASLELLVFSDEDDGSTATLQTTLSTLKGMANPFKGSFVRVHALLPGSCAPTGQTFPSWTGLVGGTGGTLHDLCASDYSGAITDLTSRIFGLLKQFFLAQQPVPSSIKVKVNGTLDPNFQYNGGSNSITLQTAPADGSVITVEYTVACSL